MRSLIIALVGASLLAGCVTPGASPIPPLPASASIVVKKSFASAETAYIGASKVYLDLTRRNLLPPAVKAEAKLSLQIAYKALNAAHTALLASDAATFSTQLNLAIQAVAQASALFPKAS
jgi:hypothetical protein